MLQVPIRAKQKPKDKLHTFLFLEGRIRTQLQSYQRKPQIKQLLESLLSNIVHSAKIFWAPEGWGNSTSLQLTASTAGPVGSD